MGVHAVSGFRSPVVERREHGSFTRFALSSAVWLAVMLVLFPAAAWGQGLGEFVGAVTDPSGAGIPNAKITVTETGTGFTRNATTSPDGLFTVASLRPSVYSVTVEAPGFRSFTQKDITLLADQRATVNVKLELGTANGVGYGGGGGRPGGHHDADHQAGGGSGPHRRTASERTQCRRADAAGARRGDFAQRGSRPGPAEDLPRRGQPSPPTARAFTR